LSKTKGATVTIVRVGTTKQYSDGWEGAFGKRSAARAVAKSKSAPSKSAAPAAKKSKKKPGRKTVKR
jgi:hypothetical protein